MKECVSDAAVTRYCCLLQIHHCSSPSSKHNILPTQRREKREESKQKQKASNDTYTVILLRSCLPQSHSISSLPRKTHMHCCESKQSKAISLWASDRANNVQVRTARRSSARDNLIAGCAHQSPWKIMGVAYCLEYCVLRCECFGWDPGKLGSFWGGGFLMADRRCQCLF